MDYLLFVWTFLLLSTAVVCSFPFHGGGRMQSGNHEAAFSGAFVFRCSSGLLRPARLSCSGRGWRGSKGNPMEVPGLPTAAD
jgi:hypothetical protein